MDRTADHPPTPSRWNARAWLKVVGLVILVGIVVHRVDLSAVQSTWRGLEPFTLFSMLASFFVAMALRMGKWGWQARRMGFTFHWPLLLRKYLAGVLLGLVTPLRVGELYRISALEMPDRPAWQVRTRAAAGLVLEKSYELAVLLGIIALGTVTGVNLSWLIALAWGAFLSLAILLFSPIRPPAFPGRSGPGRWLEPLLGPLLQAREVLTLPDRFVLLGLSLAAQLLNMYGGLLIYRAFGEMHAADFFLRVPLLTLINTVPVTIAGVGLREVSAMEVFGAIGYPASSAAVAASLLFLGANLVPLLWIAPLELYRIWRTRQLSPQMGAATGARLETGEDGP